MEQLFNICVALSLGVLGGIAAGAVKAARFKRSEKAYSQHSLELSRRLLLALGAVLKYTAAALLTIGFIWCVYFLILGILVPEQAEYANIMSQLIVGVLTVISILFAFVEFINRKGGAK